MEQYSIILAFSAENLGIADNMQAETYEAFFDLLKDNGCRYVGIQMTRGNLITEEIKEAALELDRDTILDMNSGINHNPLPEGMPEL